MTSRIVQSSNTRGRFDRLAQEAVRQAIAQQKALGLNQYSHINGRIVARSASGRFISLAK
jgi:hypothetical protein